jgi:hypothetical protein
MQGVGAQLVLRCVDDSSHIHQRERGSDLVWYLAGVQRVAGEHAGVQNLRVVSEPSVDAVPVHVGEKRIRVSVRCRRVDREGDKRRDEADRDSRRGASLHH